MVKGGLLGAAMLLGVAACTDDHYDVKPGMATGGNTIWQNIKNNADLDSVAMILERTKVMSSETDSKGQQTFAEFLNSPQAVTAWLPVNGNVNAQYYLDQLDQAEALRATDPMAALRLEYEVSKRFSRNHVARFNYDTTTGEQQVRMLNGKLCVYDAAAKKFNDVNIVGTSMASSNGSLHLLDQASPFANNVYDYLASAPEASKLFSVIDSFNVYTFSEWSSTQGTMNGNGQMEYVDSVYTRSNELLNSSYVGAYNIANEDSMYITVVPTDQAYDAARSSVESLFKYAASYNYEWKKSSVGGGVFANKDRNALKFNVDSLQQLNVSRTVLGSMFMSASQISSPLDKTDKTIPGRAVVADSLKTTSGMYVYNPNPGQPNPIFNGVEPIKASNGYIYPVDTYNYDPAYSFIQRIEIKPQSWNLAQVLNSVVANSEEVVNLTAENRNPDIKGEVENDEYYCFQVNGKQPLTVDVMLKGVYSGKYKISAIFVPNCMDKNKILVDDEKKETFEDNFKMRVSILDDKSKTIGKPVTIGKDTDRTIPQDSVTKFVLWEEFEFPYCYANLPDGFETFPVLRFYMPSNWQSEYRALSIASILLEPIRE